MKSEEWIKNRLYASVLVYAGACFMSEEGFELDSIRDNARRDVITLCEVLEIPSK